MESLGTQADGQAASEWISGEDSWSYWWSYSGISGKLLRNKSPSCVMGEKANNQAILSAPGPAYWGLLNLDWHMCDKGRRQSPINIETKRLVYDPHLGPLQLDTNLSSGILRNDGHAIVFNVSARRTRQSSSDATSTKQHPMIAQTHTTMISQQQEAATKSTLVRRSERYPATKNASHLDGNSPIGEPDLAGPSALNRLDFGQSEALELQALERPVAAGSQSQVKDSGSTLSSSGERSAYEDSAVFHGDYDDGVANEDLDHDHQDHSPSSPVQISGAGLSYGYKFEAIYFRFGLDNKQQGSEHLINSRWHLAELQVVAYNSVLYKSFSEASNKPHGLMAISMLVELSNERPAPTGKAANAELEKLLAPLSGIRYRNQMLEVRDFNLSALLPERRQFVTYEGSLNFPGCHESVDWLVLNRPLYITQSSVSSSSSL